MLKPSDLQGFETQPEAAAEQPSYRPTAADDVGQGPAAQQPKAPSGLSPEISAAMSAAAKAYDIDPGVLLGIAAAESSFDPDVVSGKRKSRAGAVGLMQFMPKTAERFGIDPTDPVQSIFGAAAYLRDNLDRFGGDYRKAIAAYNAGEGNVSKASKTNDWEARLPAETRDYVGYVGQFKGILDGPTPGQSQTIDSGINATQANAARQQYAMRDPRRVDQTPPVAPPAEAPLPLGNPMGDDAVQQMPPSTAGGSVFDRNPALAQAPSGPLTDAELAQFERDEVAPWKQEQNRMVGRAAVGDGSTISPSTGSGRTGAARLAANAGGSLMAGFAKAGEASALATAGAARVADSLWSLVTGKDSTALQDAAYKSVERAESAAKFWSPDPSDVHGVAESVVNGLAHMAPDLVAAMATGGASVEGQTAEQVAKAARGGLSAAAQQVAHGMQTMTVPAFNAGINRAADLVRQGAPVDEAVRAGMVSAATTDAIGGLPMAAGGSRLATRMGQGALQGAAGGIVQHQLDNAAVDPSRQTPLTPEDVLVQAATGAVYGAMPHGQAPHAVADPLTRASLGLERGDRGIVADAFGRAFEGDVRDTNFTQRGVDADVDSILRPPGGVRPEATVRSPTDVGPSAPARAPRVEEMPTEVVSPEEINAAVDTHARARADAGVVPVVDVPPIAVAPEHVNADVAPERAPETPVGVKPTEPKPVESAAGKAARAGFDEYNNSTDVREAAPAEAPAKAPEAPAEPARQPDTSWTGRRGDGYQTELDAKQAIGGRQAKAPQYDWRVEQRQDGKWVLNGYKKPDAGSTIEGQPAQTEPAAEATNGSTVDRAAGQGLAGGEGAPGQVLEGSVRPGDGVPGGADGSVRARGATQVNGVEPAVLAGDFRSIQDRRLKESGGKEAVKLQVVPVDAHPSLQALADAIGSPLTFVKDANGKATFGAVAMGKNRIYVNVDSPEAPLALVMHEGVHTLPTGIRDVLIRKVMDTVPEESKARFLRVYKNYSSLPEAKQHEEITAMLSQKMAKKADFWIDLHKKLGDHDFAAVAKHIAGKLNEFIDKISGRDDLSWLTNDAKAVRDAITTAYAKTIRGETFWNEHPDAPLEDRATMEGADVKELGPDETRGMFSERRRDYEDAADRTEVSTTLPYAKKGGKLVNDGHEQKWVIDSSDIKANEKHVNAVAKAIKAYNTMTGKGDHEQAMQELHHAVVDNLLWLHDQVPPDVRERAKLWYDGANRIANEWAPKYNVTPKQAAGVLAALSPQMDWFKNVSLAERVLTIWKNRQHEEWTPAMTAWMRSWVDSSKTVQEKAAREAHFEHASKLEGKTLGELDSRDAAYFIRAFDETYHPRSYRLVTPEGGFGDLVTKAEDDAGNADDAKVTWGGFDTIEKTVSILSDGSSRNISEQLGNEHKVRNFYNNIINPNSADGHVTIDTHAIAAAWVKALSGASKEVSDSMGGAGQTAATGASGSYALYADAYREAAAKRGILAREMQSITWEAIRSLFPGAGKKQMAPKVEAIWDKFRSGEITRAEARKQVEALAGGIRKMAWEGGDAGTFAKDGATSFDDRLDADPAKREGRTVPPVDAKDRIRVSLSSSTTSIPGVAELYARAQKGDKHAHALLQDIAVDNLNHLLAGTSAKVKIDRATGLYGGYSEPSIGATITFADVDREHVMAALAKFAHNFNQEQIHVRQDTKAKPGFKFDDGSYATPVYRWELSKALDGKQIQKIIDKSGLYGLTFGHDFVEAYYVGDPSDGNAIDQFRQGALRAGQSLGEAVRGDEIGVARLWTYGHGEGTIGFDRIEGDVRPGPAEESQTARRVAEYLGRVGDKPGKVKTFSQAEEITPEQRARQEQIARAYQALPDNDLKNPRVRKAYGELAKEVKRQFESLPLKVEVYEGSGEPYKSSADMRRDVLDNNHLYIYGTTPETFGPAGSDFTGHPLLAESGLKDINGRPLVYNDLLRAVHDYFAHTMSPTQFGPRGEEAAWKNHMSMTRSPWARWALTSETRGQNSWVNFRPLAQDVAVKDRPFARQKAALLPIEHSMTGDRNIDKPMKELQDSLPVGQRVGSKPAEHVNADAQFSEEPWYRELDRRIEAGPERAPAEQWKAYIRGLTTKGVKGDEIEWSGVNDWLALQNGKVSREAVMDYLRGNGVRVEETVLGEREPWRQRMDMLETRGVRNLDANERAELEDLRQRFDKEGGDATPESQQTKYNQYTLPGGTNYREVLLTLPRADIDVNADPDTLEAQLEKRRASTYKSRHWDQPNVLAHIRVNDRTDAEGKRVLFVEEIQSDWGQEGKKEGFAPEKGALAKPLQALLDEASITDMPDLGKVAVVLPTGERFAGRTRDETLSAARRALLAREQPGVPPAPFVTKTDAWLGLALKRIVTMAVEGGYDKVAFVTGEQSAERYDLSKQIERIDAIRDNSPFRDNKPFWNLDISTKDGRDFNRDGLTEDEVEGLVGKDMAKKIIEATSGDQKRARFSGLDLKVGGEGMKAFYDKIVPNAARALLKKLGGQMGDVNFDDGTGKYRIWLPDIEDYHRRQSFGSLREASDFAAGVGGEVRQSGEKLRSQPGFDITPAMREKAAGGMPMFSEEPKEEKPWDAPAPSRIDNILHYLQDKQIDLKRVTQAITKSGKQLNDVTDAYLREELYHGRVAERTHQFLDLELKPLLVEMGAAGVKIGELEEYLHARHAEERNLRMEAANEEREDNRALSGMTTERANEILASAKPIMKKLAARVDDMITGTRDLMEVSGIESPETVNALRMAYKNYVPLYRDEAHPDTRLALGRGFSVKGSNIKQATGSTEKVTNILSHIAEQREATITRAEKNLVSMALYAMAKQNPNPAFWEVDKPPKISEIDPATGQVVQRVDHSYKSQDNVIVAKVNGQDVALIFNKRNERAVRMAASLKNLDVTNLDGPMSLVAKTTRYLAAVNTQYSPVFAVKNFTRDAIAATLHLADTEINGAQGQVLAGIPAAMRAIYRMERGKPAENKEWADLYSEFKSRGAKTGYREAYTDIEERAKSLQKVIDSVDRAAPSKAVHAVLDFMHDANDSIENAVRLSAYKAALDRGLSKDRAASLAKNLTVNFNRKGTNTRTLGSMYAFFNAAIQGHARTAKALAGPHGSKIIAGGIAVGVLQALLGYTGMDDEDRERVPEYVKRTSFVIPAGKGKYGAIPYPLGLHVLPNIGRTFAEMVLASHDGKSADVVGGAIRMLSTIFDALNPIGGSESTLQMLLPTLFDPVGQLVSNKNFAGNPVYKDRQQGDAGAPGYTLARDNTNPAWKGLAWVIHMGFNGGNKYARNTDLDPWTSPQPEALRFLAESFLGGVFRESSKLIDTVMSKAKGEEADWNRIPMLSAFSGDLTTDKAVAATYYKNAHKVEEAERMLMRARKDGADVERPPEADLIGRAQATRERVMALIGKRRNLEIEGGHDDEVKQLEKDMAETMREFNDEYRAAMKKGKQ